jgi:hypothetical protein
MRRVKYFLSDLTDVRMYQKILVKLPSIISLVFRIVITCSLKKIVSEEHIASILKVVEKA